MCRLDLGPDRTEYHENIEYLNRFDVFRAIKYLGTNVRTKGLQCCSFFKTKNDSNPTKIPGVNHGPASLFE